MKVKEALEQAITFLEALGYGPGGDIYDNFALAISRLKWTAPVAMEEEL